MAKVPEASKKNESAELSMTRASQIGSFMRRESLLRKLKGVSFKNLEKIDLIDNLALYFNH